MTAERIHPFTEETGVRIAEALEELDGALDGVLSGVYTKEEADELFARKLVWDAAKGRYTNESVKAWLDSKADGLVYGVRIADYDTDPSPTAATKTGANAGLVLEPSTLVEAGRNDYAGKKLFMCPRCNGGADPDGTNYVTAIEGVLEDEHPFDPEKDTFIITPVYYRRITKADTYVDWEYADSPKAGFEACAGAVIPLTYDESGNVATSKPREFILRACYPMSDSTFDSKKGKFPGSLNASQYASPVSLDASCLAQLNAFKADETSGLSGWGYGDMAYLIEFMQLMLGVRAPKSQVTGFIQQVSIPTAITQVDYKTLQFSKAITNIEVGSTIGLTVQATDPDTGEAATTANVPFLVTAADYESMTVTIANEDAELVVTAAGSYRLPWVNGSMDDVLGTYGAISSKAMKDDGHGFKFQNCEWLTGLYTILGNYAANYTAANPEVEGSTATRMLCVAKDLSRATIDTTDESNPVLGDHWDEIAPNGASSSYIKQYAVTDGVPHFDALGGTSSTGYRTQWYCGNTKDVELSFGGYFHALAKSAALYGVGCVLANSYALSGAGFSRGGRASTIGISA